MSTIKLNCSHPISFHPSHSNLNDLVSIPTISCHHSIHPILNHIIPSHSNHLLPYQTSHSIPRQPFKFYCSHPISFHPSHFNVNHLVSFPISLHLFHANYPIPLHQTDSIIQLLTFTCTTVQAINCLQALLATNCNNFPSLLTWLLWVFQNSSRISVASFTAKRINASAFSLLIFK